MKVSSGRFQSLGEEGPWWNIQEHGLSRWLTVQRKNLRSLPGGGSPWVGGKSWYHSERILQMTFHFSFLNMSIIFSQVSRLFLLTSKLFWPPGCWQSDLGKSLHPKSITLPGITQGWGQAEDKSLYILFFLLHYHHPVENWLKGKSNRGKSSFKIHPDNLTKPGVDLSNYLFPVGG